jgi:hypothetical protein
MRIRRPVGKRPGGGRPTPGQINSVRPGIGIPTPRQINPVRPGMIQPAMVGAPPQPIRNLSNMQPINISPFNSTPGGVRGGMGPLPNNFGPMQPSSQIDPNSPRSLPFASAVGPSMQGVGDPRRGAATIPGNKFQMQMRGPTQAAPTQPVTAMKKGGVVRGGRAEIKGTRPAKLS